VSPAAPFVAKTTARSGVRIRYLDNASGISPGYSAGLPILFSPGFTDFADEYAEVLAFFAPRRVLVVEVRGRGGSEAPATGYSAAEHAADLEAVLDTEGIEHFHLLTFSRGTTWGLDVALADPARVATVSIGDYWACEKHLGGDVAERFMASRFRGKPMSERVEPHVVREVLGASIDRDLFDEVAATRLPVLVATGTEPGCLLDASTLQEWRDRVAGVELVTIPGAAHDLFRPETLAYPRAVDEFIRRRTPGT
jgi:pimeloyl-ACP methyl ester carboxylesterase